MSGKALAWIKRRDKRHVVRWLTTQGLTLVSDNAMLFGTRTCT